MSQRANSIRLVADLLRNTQLCVRRAKLVACPTGMNQEDVNYLAVRLASAIKRAWTNPGISKLDESALELWTSMYPVLTRDQAGALGAIIARAEAQVMRLSLIYALLDDRERVSPVEIEEGHLRSALAFWNYCQDSARFIFGGADTNKDASKILAALAGGEKTKAELNQLFSGHLRRHHLVAILDELEAQKRIVRMTRGGGRGQGKAATIYKLSKGGAHTHPGG